MSGTKTKRTELQQLVVQAKGLYADISARLERGEDVAEEERTKLNALIEDGTTKRAELERLEELERLDQFMNQPEGERKSRAGAPERPGRRKTWGQIVAESKEYKHARDTRAERMDRVNVKALYSGTDASGGVFVVTQRDTEVVDLPQRPRSVIDLVYSAQTESDAVEYVEMTTRTNAAAPVAEYTGGNFGLKPESNLVFALRTAPVKTIATWIPASRQVLSDAPLLRSLVDNDLSYMLDVTLENQILNGDGLGNNFTGILATAGIQVRTQGDVGDRGGEALDTKADTLRRAITDIRLEFYEATGIVLNPGDGEDLELLKDANGMYLKVYDAATGNIWRTPTVESPVIAADTALVGNWRLGATLWDRMQTEIRVGEPNDYFLRNAVAVLAELRAAFAVKRPKAFEKVTFV